MENKIIVGNDKDNPMYTFDNATVETVSCVLSSAMSGDELAIDQLTAGVYSTVYIRVRFVPSGSTGLRTSDGRQFMVYPQAGALDQLPYGTPIRYYADDVLIGKFYSSRVVRAGKAWFDITAVSLIGLLDGQQHYGGIYTGQTFPEVAADIIGSSDLFSCKTEVQGIRVYGWLPVATRRENLHQLLFSCGVTVSKDADGGMVFGFPDTASVKEVPGSRIFLGGSVDYMTPATRTEVTEHTYMRLPSDETVVLYDNTDGSGMADPDSPIIFNSPVYDLTASGSLTILESGVNFARLSGTGTLSGRKYTHTTRIILRDTGSSGEQKTASVKDVTLVNVANSENVAKRVLAYYGSARTISADMVIADEKPGEQISFSNPFGESETAFLSSMELRAGSFLRASCELVTDYVPTGQGNNYDAVVVLTGSGSWTVPTGVTRILAVLIGGGSGGSSGTDGSSSNLSGGLAGPGGKAGNVYSVALDVTPRSAIAYACGAAGVGGAPDGEGIIPGTAGTDTTFGSMSSASGAPSNSGVANLFSGAVYALTGSDGVPGGKGSSSSGDGDTVHYDGVDYYPGTKGTDREYKDLGTAYGGYGGGAAAGANGGDGQNGHTINQEELEGGDGGDGADALPGKDAASYGSGGEGGHGGGGAGQGGRPDGFPGSAGKGSKGGDGAPGCIQIYYKEGLGLV